MQKQDEIRLKHMLDAALAARQFAAGRTLDDLSHDRQLLFSLVKAVEIIGEAASKVTEETKGQSPEIPWRDIVTMRNRLIHAYFDINLYILWNTVQDDLPPLIAAITDLLAREGANDAPNGEPA